MIDVQKEKKDFMNEFFSRGAVKMIRPEGEKAWKTYLPGDSGEVRIIPTLIIETVSDDGEKIEDYFERKLIEASVPSFQVAESKWRKIFRNIFNF